MTGRGHRGCTGTEVKHASFYDAVMLVLFTSLFDEIVHLNFPHPKLLVSSKQQSQTPNLIQFNSYKTEQQI